MRIHHGKLGSKPSDPLQFHHTQRHANDFALFQQFLLAAGLSHEKSSRATNMTYTQMLFALAFDKLVFGTTPGLTSIIGSSLILGSAIYVAMQKDAPTRKEDEAGQRTGVGDEEEGRALIEAGEGSDGGGNENRDVQEVQLRTLR